MPPPMTTPITIRTPGAPATDPVTGNEVPGLPVVVELRAWLAQKSTGDVGSQVELNAAQNTTVSPWALIVPLPKGACLTSQSEVSAPQGVFAVVGRVADRPDHRPIMRAASLRLISDLQTT